MRVAWTARCKSGFEFNGKPCRRVAPRGQIMCNDCLSAERVPVVAAVRQSRLAVIANWKSWRWGVPQEVNS